jgi:antitoxin VapB
MLQLFGCYAMIGREGSVAIGRITWYRPSMTTAKVFRNGRSQAIRLPKDFRVKTSEVHLKKIPEGFLVLERDPWEICLEACQELSDGFMKQRVQPPQQRRRWRRGK